ncbi:MAG TPA: hypothetical protein VFQ53_40515 [Kofleriaceae bacterium]|nr:hypothetical protein [Kofleriaceae bacterium]
MQLVAPKRALLLDHAARRAETCATINHNTAAHPGSRLSGGLE